MFCVTHMIYTSSCTHTVTFKYQLFIKRWPLNDFIALSDLSSIILLEKLHNTLKTGKCKFCKFSPAEFNIWSQE